MNIVILREAKPSGGSDGNVATTMRVVLAVSLDSPASLWSAEE